MTLMKLLLISRIQDGLYSWVKLRYWGLRHNYGRGLLTPRMAYSWLCRILLTYVYFPLAQIYTPIHPVRPSYR